MGYLIMEAWVINQNFCRPKANKLNLNSCRYFKKLYKNHGKIFLLAYLYIQIYILYNIINLGMGHSM